MTEYLALVFIHVVGGIFWAGAAIISGFFLIPAVVEAGPSGGAVMAGVLRRKLPLRSTGAAFVTVLAGMRLYALRFNHVWAVSPEGLVLGLGGLLGLSAFYIGFFRQKPVADKIGKLSAAIALSRGKPTPEQQAEIQGLLLRLQKYAKVQAWHLVAVMVLMASHRLASAF